MPIVHTCKACGCSVSEANILNGSATRRGKSIYCAECSALILEPVEANAVAAQAAPAPAARVPAKPQAAPAAPASKISARSKLVENLHVDPPPPISSDEIEVVEQYEILTTSAPEALPDLDEPEEIDADEEEALPEEPKAGGPRRRSRVLRKRGPGGSAAATRKPSQRTIKPAERDRPSRSKIPASAVRAGTGTSKDQKPSRGSMPAAAKGNKEVFFKSGTGNRSLAQEVEEVHSDTVDSNILQSVRDMKDKKRRGQSSEKNIRRAESRTSVRSRRNTVVQRNGGNQTQIILGIVGCLALLIVLAFAFSGSNNNAAKRSTTVDEDNLPPSVYIQRAQELQRKGDKLGAADNYAKAAEAFQKQGNTSEAQRYNQAAYGLRFKTAY
ncbi:MAG: hypothetical protein KIS92_21630 [Planctomycetota bacterium]|nr:hypothetical protein [Planctomycetota bacterium]